MTRAGFGYVDPARYVGVIQPAVVLRKMHQLNRQNTQLATLIGPKETGPLAERFGREFIAEWNTYFAEWRSFFAEHQGWLDRFSSDTVEMLADMIARSNRFDERLREAGIDPGTLTREEAEAESAEEEPGLPTWAWWLIGIGVVGVGAYALYTLSRVMREGRLIGETAAGTAGLGGPTRVRDLDGPSTYNLEIEG